MVSLLIVVAVTGLIVWWSTSPQATVDPPEEWL